MWERFTDRARRAVYYAQEEAVRWKRNEVSVDHLALGLVRDGPNSAAGRVLNKTICPLDKLKVEIEKHLTEGDAAATGSVQLLPSGKRTIDLGYEAARQLGSNYIGTEHLLLGICMEGTSIAATTLSESGITPDSLFEIVREVQQEIQKKNEKRFEESVSMWAVFTERARAAVYFAQEEARQKKENAVSPEYLLLGLLNHGGLIAHKLITECGGSPEAIRSAIRAALPDGAPRTVEDLQLSESSKQAIDHAYMEAKRLDNSYIGTEHLLYGVLALEVPAIQDALAPLKISLDELHEKLVRLQDGF
jgi:ATP-dependent Clp protease ATP-binding subunit ClpA